MLIRSIKVWDITRGEKVGSLVGHENRVSCLGVSNDGISLCTGSWDSLVRWTMLQLFFPRLNVTNLLRSSRFGLIKLPATVIQMDFSSASADSSLIRDFSSPSAFKRLYYPPISDTRLRISGLRILAYAGRSDETCPTYTINSFYLFIFGRCMSPSWRHLNPDSFGDSRKRKTGRLDTFCFPFSLSRYYFLFFLYLFFSPASDPKNSLHNSFCVF